jgi:hypothetical protein
MPASHIAFVRLPATTSPVVAGDVVYIGREGGIDAFTAAGSSAGSVRCLATLAVSGTPDHLSVASGRLFVVHHPNDATLSRLTVFAPSAG